MKNKIKYTLPALVLCMSALLLPMTAYAQSAPDTTPPAISAKLFGDTLHIEATDDASGVDAIYIGEKRINYRVDNAIDVAFQDYSGTSSLKVGVYAVDFAGNKSEVVSVTNPYYKKSEAMLPAQTSKQSSTTKLSVSASTDPEQEDEAKPLTPDGQATVTDNATDKDGKEFYTFTTADDNVFYLVVDKQRDSDNVYFLNAVTENDLAVLAAKDENKKDTESAMPEVAVCDCTEKCMLGEVNINCPVCKNDLKTCVGKAAPTDAEAEVPKKENNAGSILFIILAIAAAGGAGYYFKILKPKRDLDDAEDLDDLLDDEEESEINEDTEDAQELPEAAHDMELGTATSHNDYPEDDYPDDDLEEEPEWRE